MSITDPDLSRFPNWSSYRIYWVGVPTVIHDCKLTFESIDSLTDTKRGTLNPKILALLTQSSYSESVLSFIFYCKMFDPESLTVSRRRKRKTTSFVRVLDDFKFLSSVWDGELPSLQFGKLWYELDGIKGIISIIFRCKNVTRSFG